MKVSLNTIKQFTPVDISLDELIAKINQQLGGVEQVTDLGARYEGSVIVKVESCEKHTNADKLNVCQVNDGSGELMQVVCGASNVHAGMFAVWLRPGSIVPSTAGDKEPFVLGARELRGVMSNGMLASPKELGIGDDHDGILEITEQDVHNGQSLAPGASFAEVFGLNDTIIEIENKMFTHRPDLFGQLGVAREIAGIMHDKFTSPDWYSAMPEIKDGDGLQLEVFNDAGQNVPRITFVAIKDIEVKPSPVWLQCALVALGGKPINNVVDATNYIMLLTAQPTHAYDYDKLRGHAIGARMAVAGETVTLLNAKTYELHATDIVIADAEGPVGLGGIMGGGESEVSNDTTNIVLEVATFDMYAARKSSMRHGIFTDALTRFNKGQSPLQNMVIMSHLSNMIARVAGGTIASNIHDNHGDLTTERQAFVSPTFINERLGLDLSKQEIETLLSNVEFEICESCDSDGHANDSVHYGVPFWRTDIDLPEDIVEEIGRLYGFDKLPRELPVRSTKPAPRNELRVVQQATRQRLAELGANEVLTYSFVHEKLLQKVGQDKAHAYHLSNALSPDLQYYRLSLLPSLLDKVHMNGRAGYDKFALFELGKVHFKDEMDAHEPSVPNEDNHVALVIAYSDKQAPGGAPFYHARRYLEAVIDLNEYPLTPMTEFDMTTDEWGRQLVAAYEPGRSAVIAKDGQIWGVVGELRSEVRRALKLPNFVAAFEVHSDTLSRGTTQYLPLSRFPSITQDISIRATDVSYVEVANVLNEAVHSHSGRLQVTIAPTVIYQADDNEQITTTFRLKATSYDSTLTDDDVRPMVEAINRAVEQSFGGRVV
ncbi:MAG: phenylalanine--tRNA ligase subunit beta [Patescibacteria group bacterium]